MSETASAAGLETSSETIEEGVEQAKDNGKGTETRFDRSKIFGHFLDADVERSYIALLCGKWRRRLQVSFCVMSLHVLLMSVATFAKWNWYPFQLAGTMLHDGKVVNMYDIVAGTASQAIYFPLVTIGFTIGCFSNRVYQPKLFRWLITAFILTATVCGYLPQVFGWLAAESMKTPPLLDGIARPTCEFLPTADASCIAAWTTWHERFPRTTRVREEAASWYIATTAMYFVIVAALPLPSVVSLVACVVIAVVSWSDQALAIRLVYGDYISYTPFTQLIVLVVAVVYISRLRDNADREAFKSQLLIAEQTELRMERLIVQKERADYDRAMAEQTLNRLAPFVPDIALQNQDRNLDPHALFLDGSSSSGSKAASDEIGRILAGQAASSDGTGSENSSLMLSPELKHRLEQTLSSMGMNQSSSKDTSSSSLEQRTPAAYGEARV